MNLNGIFKTEKSSERKDFKMTFGRRGRSEGEAPRFRSQKTMRVDWRRTSLREGRARQGGGGAQRTRASPTRYLTIIDQD